LLNHFICFCASIKLNSTKSQDRGGEENLTPFFDQYSPLHSKQNPKKAVPETGNNLSTIPTKTINNHNLSFTF